MEVCGPGGLGINDAAGIEQPRGLAHHRDELGPVKGAKLGSFGENKHGIGTGGIGVG